MRRPGPSRRPGNLFGTGLIWARAFFVGAEYGRESVTVPQETDGLPIEALQFEEPDGELFKDATLPLGDGEQSPEDYARQQSASTGLPVPRSRLRGSPRTLSSR